MTFDRLSADPRVTVRRRGEPDYEGEAVVYWMQRAQRAVDNPALDLAIAAGNLLAKPVVTFFGLSPFIVRANLRHYQFLAEGLPDIATGLRKRRVGFALCKYPDHRLMAFVREVRPALVIGDESPLRQTEGWRERIAEEIRVPFWTVDADVVVPSALIESEQYAARTIRPRLHRHLETFLVEPDRANARVSWPSTNAPEGVPGAVDILKGLPIDRAASTVSGLRGGLREARRHLRRFVQQALGGYDRGRNHPEIDGTSRLSAYLHFGQIGPREVARTIRGSAASAESIDAFIEQLIVRRELAVNFVRFNDAYDRLAGCESWARQTLRRHSMDRRDHRYAPEALEAADTHDPLWNAAQRQMLTTGWMHGYVRMYWAKKILAWSSNAEAAFETAVLLNDRYELDGRDPNGYANIAWAIGGKHDRPWPSRPVYGTVRSMAYANTIRKFDARAYIERYGSASDLAAFDRNGD